MKHLDLFSGIGGFARAAETVWPDIEHTFCDNEPFSQQVLKKHWPAAKIHGDIRTLINTGSQEQRGLSSGTRQKISEAGECYLLTGGFPCQPFSQAGRRKGTADDRHLWPEMLRVIREFRPRWVVGENVAGLITWDGGVVLRQVLSDLEGEGYEVQAFVIPACAVNAPHRRDRVWIVAHASGKRRQQKPGSASSNEGTNEGRLEKNNHIFAGENKIPYSDSNYERLEGSVPEGNASSERRTTQHPDAFKDTGQFGSRLREPRRNGKRSSDKSIRSTEASDWNRNWLKVAAELCGMDDGLPAELDGFKLSKPGHRNARLKALGNSIVPQVAIQIFKAIKVIDCL